MTLQRYAMREHMRAVTGLDDVSGIELLTLTRLAASLSDALEARASGDEALSGARFGLLLRLLVEEDGHSEGITPTAPARLKGLNEMAAALTASEREMAGTFMDKLCRSHFAGLNPARGECTAADRSDPAETGRKREDP